ncbi:MAG: hypothetical protein RL885_09245 [Planctomycetota bacterium]
MKKSTKRQAQRADSDFILMHCPRCGKQVYYLRHEESSCCRYEKAKRLITEKL